MIKQFSYSQALLALAIGALAWSMFKFTLYVPEILKVIEKISNTVDLVTPQIEVIIDEVALVRKEVSKVRELIDQQTPTILAQVEATRPVISEVIKESQKYSTQLPALLSQLANIEKQVTSLQKGLPAILKRVDSLVQTTNKTTAEVARWRPHSSQYLKEIALSREYIPQYLTRIENTIEEAKTVGKEASSGLVSGFFKGVLSLPFEVVSGLAGIIDVNSRSAKYLTAKDVALMQEKIVVLLNDSNQSQSLWHNTDSGNRGTMTKGKKITRNNQDCYNLTLNNYFYSNKETLKETLTELMCINSKGLWKVI
ncbi:MAG: hypothetical protein V5789_01420 [Colwellia sp.]